MGFSLSAVSASQNSKKDYYPIVKDIKKHMNTYDGRISLDEYNDIDDTYVVSFFDDDNNHYFFDLSKSDMNEYTEGNLSDWEKKTIGNHEGYYQETHDAKIFRYNVCDDIYLCIRVSPDVNLDYHVLYYG